jgi:hypothetical protein
MAAFWAVFTFGGSGPAITTHGSDLKFKFTFIFKVKPTTTKTVLHFTINLP